MLYNLFFLKLLHFPAQQLPEFRADNLLFTRCSRLFSPVGPSGHTNRWRGSRRRRPRRSRLPLSSLWRIGEVALLIDGLDRALESAEKRLGSDESTLEVDCAGEFVDLIEVSILAHVVRGDTYHISKPHQSVLSAP